MRDLALWIAPAVPLLGFLYVVVIALAMLEVAEDGAPATGLFWEAHRHLARGCAASLATAAEWFRPLPKPSRAERIAQLERELEIERRGGTTS